MDEKRRSTTVFRSPKAIEIVSFRPRCVRYIGITLVLLTAASCTHESSSPAPMTLKQKQEATLRDPMNYKPDNENTTPYDISGGGINNLDRGALKRDIDNVFNP